MIRRTLCLLVGIYVLIMVVPLWASFAIGNGEKAVVLGVHQTSPESSSTYRYNYGFVETAGHSATVQVKAIDEDGTVLATDTVSLGGYEAWQYNLKDRLLGSPNVTNVRLEVRVTGGSGRIIAFGTGLANESSEVLIFYTGNAILDANGEAVVELPAWFEAINADFRYQLTALSGPMPKLWVGQRIEHNQFTVSGGTPGGEVSWQVTARRNDPGMRLRPFQVERKKPTEERGVKPWASGDREERSPDSGIRSHR